MHFTHRSAVETEERAAGRGGFGYLFEEAARTPDAVLPTSDDTVNGLLDLGAAMGDPGTRADAETTVDGCLPSAITYFAQFIAHDLTARDARRGGLAPVPDRARDCARDLAPGQPLTPMTPTAFVQRVANARRPAFDLAGVYGDGPSLAAEPGCPDRTGVSSEHLYDGLRLKVRFDRDGLLDLPRHAEGPRAGQAIVGDGRNDRCLNLSQFHAAWLRFHNVVFESTHGCSDQSRWSQTRRLVRWTYQYLVVNEFLAAICDPAVLDDVLTNGPRFFRAGSEGRAPVLPLEFALAAMPLADAMVRPAYRVNDDLILSLDDIRMPAESRIGPDRRLKTDGVISWRHYVELSDDGQGGPQRARPIAPRLTRGFGGRTQAVRAMTGQAQHRLVRGYLASLPTGQAVAARMGIAPLSSAEVEGEDPVLARAVCAGGFAERTPLWFYILREAEAQRSGRGLGTVGSRLMAETVIGLIRADPASYLNHPGNRAVTATGIEIASGFNAATIGSLADLVRYAGLRR